jgi:polar amino acid transport system ATP-binding protein/sulfate transport system ATP-binding protein
MNIEVFSGLETHAGKPLEVSIEHTLKETLVKLENVSLSFGDKLVLKPTTIEVKDIHRPGFSQGQVVGILGPSGIGKTVFSRILAGLQTPTSGEIFVSDLSVDPTGAKLQKVRAGLVGMVAQNYPLFPWRTVLGNLLVALEHTTLSPTDKVAKATEYLNLFELADKVDKYPQQLSGGQRQRVAIIRQLLSSGTFLVMDEPFTGLDPVMKDATCELIDKVAGLDEKNTIFIVAHDISALVQTADQLWLFGREKEGGKFIPGATIKHQYNLIERGLAWQPHIASTKKFGEFVAEIRAQFNNL